LDIYIHPDYSKELRQYMWKHDIVVR